MGTTITLPEELGKRMATMAQALHVDADVLAIDALDRFLAKLEDDARTTEAIARFKAGTMRFFPGEDVFARLRDQGAFTEDDLAQARADERLEGAPGGIPGACSEVSPHGWRS